MAFRILHSYFLCAQSISAGGFFTFFFTKDAEVSSLLVLAPYCMLGAAVRVRQQFVRRAVLRRREPKASFLSVNINIRITCMLALPDTRRRWSTRWRTRTCGSTAPACTTPSSSPKTATSPSPRTDSRTRNSPPTVCAVFCTLSQLSWLPRTAFAGCLRERGGRREEEREAVAVLVTSAHALGFPVCLACAQTQRLARGSE